MEFGVKAPQLLQKVSGPMVHWRNVLSKKSPKGKKQMLHERVELYQRDRSQPVVNGLLHIYEA